MNDKEKQESLKKYKEAKEHGEHFFPDSLFKDAVIALIVFLILISLAYFLGAPLEARADPADTFYTPRPEWYFLFLFQLLKYFPGKLEVLGVVIIPTVAVILLFLLPFLDRSNKRHGLGRPVIIGITALVLAGIVFLTVQAYLETPPPVEAAAGDPIANLYTKNCAGCHGSTITVKPGANLHAIIALGSHDGMPAWNADLTADQIDALAGFILSPGGNTLFVQHCGSCHEVTDLVSINPIELKHAIDQGAEYLKHNGLSIPEWKSVLDPASLTLLLNFLVAPDGQRLFTINCSSCHGQSVAFTGDEAALRKLISQGGMHLEMPPWRERLTDAEIDTLARYVVDPASTPEGQNPFGQYCISCHGNQVPQMSDIEQARQMIASGGAHQTMPVWGDLLTDEQLSALATYTLSASSGTSQESGQKVFVSNCSPCHGEFGEGGVNPTQPNDIIAPISTSEYLKTRDDFTLKAVISEGQPNLGMSPFGTSFGGPLSDDEIDAVVTFLRSWEANPPVEIPPEAKSGQTSQDAELIFVKLCSQCHGNQGEGGIGPSLQSSSFQGKFTDQEIFNTINQGHDATAMIQWGDILSSDQIQQLVIYIRKLSSSNETSAAAQPAGPTTTPGVLSFDKDVLPIFTTKCNMCHGISGGWDGTSYESAMSTGDHAPVIIAEEAENSLLAQKLLGTQTQGALMPPFGALAEKEIQIILDWIDGGALK